MRLVQKLCDEFFHRILALLFSCKEETCADCALGKYHSRLRLVLNGDDFVFADEEYVVFADDSSASDSVNTYLVVLAFAILALSAVDKFFGIVEFLVDSFCD